MKTVKKRPKRSRNTSPTLSTSDVEEAGSKSNTTDLTDSDVDQHTTIFSLKVKCIKLFKMSKKRSTLKPITLHLTDNVALPTIVKRRNKFH